jgi:hypothetical protein
MPQPALPPPGFDDLSPEETLDYIQGLRNRLSERSGDVPTPDWDRQVVAERLVVDTAMSASRASS